MYLPRWIRFLADDYKENSYTTPSTQSLMVFLKAKRKNGDEYKWSRSTAEKIGNCIKKFTDYYLNMKMVIEIPLELNDREKGARLTKARMKVLHDFFKGKCLEALKFPKRDRSARRKATTDADTVMRGTARPRNKSSTAKTVPK